MKNYYFAVNHSFGNFVQVITSKDIVLAENLSRKLAGNFANISQITNEEVEILVNNRGYKIFLNHTN
jgi:hypothetical protein